MRSNVLRPHVTTEGNGARVHTSRYCMRLRVIRWAWLQVFKRFKALCDSRKRVYDEDIIALVSDEVGQARPRVALLATDAENCVLSRHLLGLVVRGGQCAQPQAKCPRSYSSSGS